MRNKTILIVLTACMAVLVLLVVQTSAADKPNKPTAHPAEWKLPANEDSIIDGLAVSADGEKVFFTIMNFSEEDPRRAPDIKCWMLETKKGKLTNLSDVMNKKVKTRGLIWEQAYPSPDGKHVQMKTRTAGKPRKQLDYLLTLKDGKVRKLIESAPPMFIVWGGGKLYIGCVRADKKLGPIRSFDPLKGTSSELKVCGLPAAADPKGRFIICGCNPDTPAKPMTKAEFRKAFMVLVTPEGKVLLKLVAINEMSDLPVLSPSGKYVAFSRQKWDNPRQPPKLLGIEILSTDGKIKRTIKGKAIPLAVTDAGEVIATVRVSWDSPASVKFFDVAGKSRTVVAETKAAVVAGNRLFYVTPGKQPVIKSVPLKIKK